MFQETPSTLQSFSTIIPLIRKYCKQKVKKNLERNYTGFRVIQNTTGYCMAVLLNQFVMDIAECLKEYAR